MLGTTLAHYHIRAKLGEGGMGEVYLAEDTKLGRDVALKVLPEAMASDPERLERFKREARSIAALNHPSIVTIYSVEEADTRHLLTMELVEGRSLDQILPPAGLPIGQFFSLATQIADGLAAAHAKGMTHRDLKPANVMVTPEGRVKVLDFGLAKLAESATPTDDATELMTKDGMILGTVPYMSPEQVQGQPVDPRSDVFSLGILLYEMATGTRPFQGENPASVISAVLRDQPEPLAAVKPQLPNHLGRIVHRCLEKDPERRYPSAREVRAELEALRDELKSGPSTAPGVARKASGPFARTLSGRALRSAAAIALLLAVAAAWWLWRGARQHDAAGTSATAGSVDATAKTRPRLVVLPFDNLGAPDDDYFAAGMTEEVTNRLASVPELAVISRQSALQYKGTDKTMAQIGEELGVAYVLEGTVRWAPAAGGGSRVRITQQLIDVSADTHVWSQTFDHQLDDVFEIQSEIAQAVVSQLGVAIGGDSQPAGGRPTDDLEAYQLYLRARYLLDSASYTAADYREAVELLEQAVERDPDFGEAWSSLAEAHGRSFHFGFDATESRRQAAGRALEEATRLRPDASDTYLARGYYRYYCFKDYDAAVELFRQARERMADPAEALQAEAYVLRRLARFDEAERVFERSVENNSRNPKLFFDLGETRIYARRYADAIAAFDMSQALQPTGNASGSMKAWTHWLWKGRQGLPAARAALEAPENDPSDGYYVHNYLWQLVYEGEEEKALAFLDQAPGDGWIRHPEMSYPKDLPRALILERTGRRDEALAAYRRAAATLEQEIERAPEDFRLDGPLGMAYAGLGRREEALASARRGTERMPLASDSLNGAARLWELAAVQAKVGDVEGALESYARLIEFTGGYSVPFLELDVWMDPVREHPGYEALVAP